MPWVSSKAHFMPNYAGLRTKRDCRFISMKISGELEIYFAGIISIRPDV